MITASGGTWAPPGDLRLLTPGPGAMRVAAGRQAAFYFDTRIGGVRAMVYTIQLAPGLALQVAQSLSTTDLEVASVRARSVV